MAVTFIWQGFKVLAERGVTASLFLGQNANASDKPDAPLSASH